MKKIKIYDKITEQIVREVFFALREELGYEVLSSRTEFPDYIIRRGGKLMRAEVEVKASNFFRHGHPLDNCDMIICYENDLWYHIPLKVIELKDFIEVEEEAEEVGLILNMRKEISEASNSEQSLERVKEKREIEEKIIAFLTKNYPLDFNVKEIADAIKVSKYAITYAIEAMDDSKKVIVSRIFNKTKLYTVPQNEITRGLSEEKKDNISGLEFTSLKKSERVILKFLRDEYPKDISIGEIIDYTKYALGTIRKSMEFLTRLKLIIHTRTQAVAKLYTINLETDKQETLDADKDESVE